MFRSEAEAIETIRSELYLALEQGDVNTVRSCVANVLDWPALPLKDKKFILEASNQKNVQGFYQALINGHLAAARAFIEGIFRVQLDQEAQEALIEEIIIAIVFDAFQRNLQNCIQVFIAAVLEAQAIHLDNVAKQTLLTAMDLGVISKSYVIIPGFAWVLLVGHVETAQVFIESILRADPCLLDSTAKQQLLLARTATGQTGLTYAFMGNQESIITFYVQAVLQACPRVFEAQEVYELLAARNSEGIFALEHALKTNAGKQVIQVFFKEVLESDLSCEIKQNLLELSSFDTTQRLWDRFSDIEWLASVEDQGDKLKAMEDFYLISAHLGVVSHAVDANVDLAPDSDFSATATGFMDHRTWAESDTDSVFLDEEQPQPSVGPY